ncbi:MAG: SDR family NAD(P)-dependent oxidoreductase [Rhodospirillales bacterium]|nr:SDR family NAD(P)-dependent oxidoreductase [Rhodospirillales bacterium]
MSSEISGRVAFISGASSGLGRRFAEVLAQEGARIAIAARRLDRLESLAAELRAGGAEITCLAMDAASTPSVREAAAAAESALGPIEILVNNAGISHQARLEAVEEADFDAVMNTNLRGAFFLAQSAARQMIRHGIAGRIVNIASIAAMRTLGQQSVYSISKAAMVQMTHAMAREWGRHGINTNAICPGYIATEISAEFLQTDAGQRMVAGLPRRRMGEARDLDGVLRLLCSGEAARFINGAVITADDGYTSF